MKFNKILPMALAGLLTVGCADLDTEPQGGTITADQKAEVIANNPERVSASVTAITTMFSVYMNALGSGNGYHNDFGYPSVMMLLDCRGTDFVGLDTGYNWFSYGFSMNDNNYNSVTTHIVWRTLYNQIYAANSVASLIDAETEDSDLQFYLAQAVAIRAFDYFNLAQVYQFTYKGNEDALCVPLITDANADAAAANGCARATVKEVYDQIMADLDLAVDLLSKTNKTRDDKRYVDLAVAYGLRARVNLVMQNWAAAAADAQAAIKETTATPKSFENASEPTFVTMDEEDWMWGIKIAETDRVVTSGIVNWPSHMGSLNYGYASVGAWRRINPTLYNMISDTDCRKGWFLDANGKSANLSEDQQTYLDNAGASGEGAPAYTQVKFGPYKGEIYQETNANDIPLMRVEEMYLILAEAQAMGGNASQGASTLQTFVQTYRDPAYNLTYSSDKSVQDAVWIQRRIEFWGEGFHMFDILRLRKGVNRAATEWKNLDENMPQYNFNIPDSEAAERASIEAELNGNGDNGGKPIDALILQLPKSEVEANSLINDGDNNLASPQLIPEK